MKSSKIIFASPLWLLALLILPAASHAAITRPLTTGSSGNDVLELQETLRTKGYFTYPVSTGFFGSVTKQAVAGYQAASGLEPVGSVGPKTRALINSGGGAVASGGGGGSSPAPTTADTGTSSGSGGSVAATPSFIVHPLASGSTGSEVSTLQSVLARKGFLTGTPTGIFDTATVEAVIAFQAANGLEAVGIVGPKTRALINNEVTVADSSGITSSTDTNTSSDNSGGAAVVGGVSGGGSSSSSGSSGTSGGSSSSPGSTSASGSSSSGSTSGSSGGGISPVPVSTAAAPTMTFTASTTSIPLGGSVTFTWSSTNASSCAVRGGWGENGLPASGTRTLNSVNVTKGYFMSCTGAGGKTAEKLITINVGTGVPDSGLSSVSSTLTGNYPMYPGCQAPDTTYLRTLYFDPINGNDTTGNGSLAKPLKSFVVFVSNRKLMPGDHIILLAGDNGALVANRYVTPTLQDTSRWIWLDFQPGATMKSMNINVSHWIITKPEMTGGTIGTLIISGAGTGLIIADGTFYSAKSTAGWGATDWMNAQGGIFVRNTVCASVIRNTIYNIRGGIFVATDTGTLPGESMKALVQDNTITNLSADGMRPLASDIIIRGNKILGEHVTGDQGDGNHDDAIQMYALDGVRYHNVIIDHNWLQDRIVPNEPFQAPFQGIDTFQGIYTDVQITNNVILTGIYHGIAEYGTQNSLIANNTLANDMGTPNVISWILSEAGTVPQYTPPYGTIIKNNVAPIVQGDPVVIMQNNLSFGADPTKVFKTFDIAHSVFDLHPLPGGPIDGKGIGAFPTGTPSGGSNTPTTVTETGAQPTCTLVATPVNIHQEQASTLTLTSTNAASAVIDTSVGSLSVNGTASVSPLEDTVYTATVTGAGGTAACSTKVVVGPATHVSVPANSSGPVIQYSFDTPSIINHIVRNLAPYNFYTALTNGATIAAGKSGQALALSGGTQGAVSDPISLNALSITNAMSVSAWIYPRDTVSQSAAYAYIAAQGMTSNSLANLGFSFASQNFTVGPTLIFSDGTNRLTVGQRALLTTGRWYHVAGVLEGTTASLYVNGTLVATSSNPAFKGINPAANPISVGFDGVRGTNSFPGSIDDFRLYNRALSTSEIAGLASGALAIAAPAGSAPFTHQLALGSKGTEVSALQGVLKSLGLYTYPSITGYLGEATKNAVAAFQKQNQLAAVGQVGPQTRSLLNSIAASLHLPF